MPKKKPGLVYFDVTPIPAHIGLCTDRESFFKEMQRLDIVDETDFVSPGADATTRVFLSPEGGDILIMVTIDLMENLHEDIDVLCGLIAHEALHVAEDIKNETGVDGNSEFRAYLIGSLTQMFMRFIIGELKRLEEKDV